MVHKRSVVSSKQITPVDAVWHGCHTWLHLVCRRRTGQEQRGYRSQTTGLLFPSYRVDSGRLPSLLSLLIVLSAATICPARLVVAASARNTPLSFVPDTASGLASDTISVTVPTPVVGWRGSCRFRPTAIHGQPRPQGAAEGGEEQGDINRSRPCSAGFQSARRS